MTAATTTAPEAATAPRSWLRRHRAAVLVAAALVVATTAAVISDGGDRYSGDLDPQSSDPAGGRAVARVLADQGIDVEIVRDAASLAAARPGVGTTVVVTGADALGRSTARQLLDQVGPDLRAGRSELVVVDPGIGAAELLGVQDGLGFSRSRTVAAGCADSRFTGLRLETRSGTFYPAAPGACFAEGDGALVTETAAGTTVLGAADLLSNDQVDRSDNAAIALRLLGSQERLVWYVPDPEDLRGDDAVTFSSLLPRWIGPGLFLGSVAVLAVMLWRGRRLGPLAVEPLPVAVTAIETTRSRGRLYRKVNDRGYAAGALRHAARAELTEHLLLPRHTAGDVDLLVRVLTSHTSRTSTELRDLLSAEGPVPGTDKDLITLANALAELSREVRRP